MTADAPEMGGVDDPPDDHLASSVRTLDRDLSLTLSLMADTIHDNPRLVADVLEADEPTRQAVRPLVDQIYVEYESPIPIDGDVLAELVCQAVERARGEHSGGGR